jgi:hypothetical protein
MTDAKDTYILEIIKSDGTGITSPSKAKNPVPINTY